jgi:toxin ParE1/3/4
LSPPYVIAPAADRDTDNHFRYIARHNYEAAVRFLRATEASYDRLVGMPELGERQEYRQQRLAGLRAWQVRGFENYLIFYRPIEHGIEIVRVLHAARDIAALFEDET